MLIAFDSGLKEAGEVRHGVLELSLKVSERNSFSPMDSNSGTAMAEGNVFFGHLAI